MGHIVGSAGTGTAAFPVMTRFATRTAGLRIVLLLMAALACGLSAAGVLPRAYESAVLLWVQDDPAALAERQLDRRFNREAAEREIAAALAAGDPELARSFVALAHSRGVPLSGALVTEVDAAERAAAGVASKAASFTRGLIGGEPDDLMSLAGTAAGDLFVFGDIRDAAREASRWAAGQEADRLILGLSAVGIAITAGTYASLGAGAPARIGLSAVKAARKTGRLGAGMGEAVARSLRGAVDWSGLRRAMARASLTEPALAVRGVREAVKIEKADDLFRLTRDVGRVQTKAGTRAAFDGLKLAESPREMARIAKLAEKEGGKTRAILKFLGRGAITLTAAAFDLALWVLWAALLLWGFLSSFKGAVERTTWRYLQWRKSQTLRRLVARPERVLLSVTSTAT
jgi:hypothetical protein